jgi:PHD/YefM family antitoxin component YafN of YafNO toxin-antitoxin module
MKEKFYTTNELANDASKILRSLVKNESAVILRYSEPVGVLISWDDYKKMQARDQEQVKECKSCLGTLKRKS